MNSPAFAARGATPCAPRPTIAIVGAGRAGTALGRALDEAGYRIVAVHSLSQASAERLALRCGAVAVDTAVAAVRRAHLTLLTVPDRAVTRVAATLAASGMALRGHAVVHCSGATGAAALAAARQQGAAVGCCHPLQALARGAGAAELRGVFFGIEADRELVLVLERLVDDLGGIAFGAPHGDRSIYHAAAVLAGNAPLALLARAAELLELAGVDAEVAGAALATLLEGAARNARRMGPRAALTGPVVRDDATTVAAHLAALSGDAPAERLYRVLAAETLRAVGGSGREQVTALLGAPARAERPPRQPASASAGPRRRAAKAGSLAGLAAGSRRAAAGG